MSLGVSVLTDALIDFALPGRFPGSHQEAGQRWAAAYASYAASAQTSFGASPASLSGPRATLATLLGGAFASGGDTSSQIAAGLVSFWMTPPVAFAGGRSGLVSGAPGGSSLGSALAAVFLSNIRGSANTQDACRAIASVLDSFTRTVLVTSPLPAPPIVSQLL